MFYIAYDLLSILLFFFNLQWLAFMRDACKRPGNWNYENDPVINWTCDDKEDQTEVSNRSIQRTQVNVLIFL